MTEEEKVREVLRSITKDCHCKDCFDPYCTLVEIIIASGKGIRFLIQAKCVEKYRYEINEKSEKKMTWNEAYFEWIEKGLAKVFADEYREDISFEEIYAHIKQKH